MSVTIILNGPHDNLRQVRRVQHHARVAGLIEYLPPASATPRFSSVSHLKNLQTDNRTSCNVRGWTMLPDPPCILMIFSTLLYFHTVFERGSQGAGGRLAGRGAGRVARPLAFSTALSRSVGRSASQSTTLVFFVYFLFYSFICHSDLTAV